MVRRRLGTLRAAGYDCAGAGQPPEPQQIHNPLRHTDPSGHAVCMDADCSWVVHPVSGNLIRRGYTSPPPTAPTWSWRQFVADAFTFNIFDVGTVGESRPTVQMQGQTEAAYWQVVTFTRAHTPRPILAATDAMARFLDEHPEVMMGFEAAMMTTGAPPSTFSRFMSEAELEAVQETGLLRGGRPGRTYFTTNKYQKISSAQEKLALPDPPELRVDFNIKNAPKVSGPEEIPAKFGRTGGGIQYYTDDPVQVEIIRIRRLR